MQSSTRPFCFSNPSSDRYVDLYYPLILKYYYTGEGLLRPDKVPVETSRLAVQKTLEFEKLKVLGICGSDASYRSAANRALTTLQKEGYKEVGGEEID